MRSLAADILKRAESGDIEITKATLPSESKARPTMRKYGEKWFNPMYGVQHLKKTGQYRARPRHNHRPFELGTFNTAERASVAVRLFKHWQKLGYGDIPKPPYGKY